MDLEPQYPTAEIDQMEENHCVSSDVKDQLMVGMILKPLILLLGIEINVSFSRWRQIIG